MPKLDRERGRGYPQGVPDERRPRLSDALARALRVGAGFGAVAVAMALSRGCAPSQDVAALAVLLGDAAHGTVLPEDVRWEESRGIVADAESGRWVLFLSRASAASVASATAAISGAPTESEATRDEATRDVWRARVRVSPEGRPLDLIEAHNLTATPLGDDHALVVRGRYAAYATRAYEQEQSVTLLDLTGEGPQDRAVAVADRAMSCITNVQRTGRCDGIGRVDVTLERAARAVGLALGDAELAIDLVEDAPSGRGGAGAAPTRAVVRHVALDLAKGELTLEAPGLHAEPATHLPKRLSHWAVDTVRAVPWIGPAPIAWLEEKVFALRDDANKLAFKVKGGDGGELAQGVAGAGGGPAAALDTSEASIEGAHWPPPKITTIWKTPEANEGDWVSAQQAWMRKVPGTGASAPSAFYRTFLRPDEERPYAKVLLVAMDTRQLDFEMEAGSEDPKPLTGAMGTGKLPRDPAIFQKVVATFNGGFKTEHGYYGMMVKRRVLLPPQPGAASVVTLKDGRVGLGSWGSNKTMSGLQGIADDELVSMRQNLDALVDHGQVNPSGRSLWGYSAPGKGVQTERSGLCVTTAGHLLYAWGDDVSATTMAKAMKMAGCDYGMHLDMNPFHTGFMFTRIEDLKTKRYQTELLSSGMEIPKDRYVEWAPKDFFYVTTRDATPVSIDGGGPWKPDGGAQPAPAWMTGVWTTELEVASGAVEIVDVEAGRASWRIRAGIKDAPMASPLRELATDDAKRALFAVGLGVADAKHPRGLVTDGRLAIPMHGQGTASDTAALVATPEGKLVIERANEVAPTFAAGSDLAELALVLNDGVVVADAGHTSHDALRMALGTTPEGRVMIARGTFASDQPLAEALKRAGCTRAVALDRGSHSAPFLHRSGLATAPLARYDDSVLYAIATPMKPRAFRFDAVSAAVQAKR